MKNTKTFLLAAILIMVIVIFSFQTVFQIISFKDISENNIETILKTKAEKEAEILYAKLNSTGEKAASLATAISHVVETDLLVLKQTIEKELKSSEMVFGMGYWMEPYYRSRTEKYYGPYVYKDKKGDMQITWKYSNGEYNYLSKDWYIKSLQKEKRVVYTSPYYDEILDTTFLTCSSPIIKYDKIIGVATADITLREIRKYTTGISVNSKGYAYIVTPEGYYWAKGQDPSSDLKTRITDEYEEKLRDLGRHIVDTEISGVNTSASADEIVAWAPIGDTGMKLVMHYPQEEYFAPIRSIVLKGIIAFIFAVAVFIIVLNLILASKIEEPLKQIIKETAKVLLKSDVESTATLENQLPDELTFDNMIKHIKILLEERNRHIEQLHSKSVEISGQKEEITALYEETTAMNSELFDLVAKIESAYMSTVRALSNAIEANDKYTKGHCEKVACYAVNTGMIMGLSGNDLKTLEYASLLHDIGKIGIPNHILNKPGSLSKEEYDLMKKHPEIGYEILRDIDFLSECVKVIYQHHERPDGKGYPKGLKEEDIAILAKIVSVADAFDSMTRARSYRTVPYSMEEACRILAEGSGSQFSTEVVASFLKMLEENNLVDTSKIVS